MKIQLLSLILAGGLGAIAALWTWTTPGNPALFPTSPDDSGVQITILNNGFHTDMVVPRAALEADGGPLAEASRSLAPGDWVLIGWGDAKFYVDQGSIASRLPDGVRAFFRPGNASVLMLGPERRPPMETFVGDRRTLRLSRAGFAAMRAHIQASLTLRDGHPQIGATRPATGGADDAARFFASRETFWIGHLCNHWTARVLNAAGLPIRPLRAATSGEVMNALDRANAGALHAAPVVAR